MYMTEWLKKLVNRRFFHDSANWLVKDTKRKDETSFTITEVTLESQNTNHEFVSTKGGKTSR